MANERLLVLGMGNKFLGDDGVGLVVAEELQKLLTGSQNITVELTNWGGMRIIDLLANYDKVIVIDAIKTNKYPAGHIHRFDYKQLVNSVRMVSFHDINFATAVELGKKLAIKMPDEFSIYAIEANDLYSFNENLSAEVEQSVKKCIELICNEIDSFKLLESKNVNEPETKTGTI